jgi:hypothetical protein
MPSEFDIASQAQSELLGKAQAVLGLINYRKTTKNAAKLAKERPVYKDSGLDDKDLSLAESDLSGGMSARAETAYKQQSDKQFAASLEAMLRGGGSVNNVADVFGNSQEGALRLSQLQDQLRLQQINNVVRARRYKDEQLDKSFMFNKFQPWADKTQANSRAREEASKAVWSGLQTSTSAGSNALSNESEKQDFAGYFGNGNRSSNQSSGFIEPSVTGDNNGLSYQSPNFDLSQPNNYNWYQPENSNQPRVAQPEREQVTSFNDYNTDFLNDPSWWQEINGLRFK